MRAGADEVEASDPDVDATTLHVRKAREGEETSLAWLIARFTPFLRVQASYRLRGPLRRLYDPDDLVDEVWACVLPRLGDIRERDGRCTPVLLSFLSRTLLNRANQMIERELRAGQRGAASPATSTGDPLERLPSPTTSARTRVARDEIAQLTQQALEELDEPEREILVLRGIEQLSNNEVARLLGVAASTATERYQRALQRLRARLPGSVFEDMPRA
ncbi:MAG TPA: sigma-70 family RNA polymerase sigma factor [Thermoanaerobaculia bacterium]